MPVQFISAEQRQNYGRYAGEPSSDELTRYFHLNDTDLNAIAKKRGDHNRLGFASQLTTVRFLGTFLEDPTDVPNAVLQTLSRQLHIQDLGILSRYKGAKQRWEHIVEIRSRYGFKDWNEPTIGFRLTRWLYALCWTGTEQASVLFDRATVWMLSNKVILPGCTTLERFVAKLRSRVETRLWLRLGQNITVEQCRRLQDLLKVPPQGRSSWLDKLRTGPVRVSGRSLVAAILRLQIVRDLGIKLPKTSVSPSRLASLARFAGTAKVTAIIRLPPVRRLATLVAFIHCLEATAQDDVVEVLDILLNEFYNQAAKADKKARLRTLKDLDKAAMVLVTACRAVLNDEIDDNSLREIIFSQIPPNSLAEALDNVNSLVRPPDDIFYFELEKRYRSLRLFIPTLLKHIAFGASPAGKSVVEGFEWLKLHELRVKPKPDAPSDVITKPWQRYVLNNDSDINIKAYTLCVFDELRKALRRRDIFVNPSWRYADPRAGLLEGIEWENTRPIVCRSLELSSHPEQTLSSLALELDQTYKAVAARLPDNPAVRFESNKEKSSSF